MRLIQTAPAILSTATRSQLVDFRRALYAEAHAGRISEDQLERFDQLANERERALNGRREAAQGAFPFAGTIAGADAPTPSQRALWPPTAPSARRSPFSTGKRPTRSPDRERSARRMCRTAAGKPLPDKLRWQFTEHGRAVLEIVARDHVENGRCTKFTGEIGGHGGVSESTVRRTMQRAEEKGLLRIERRPRPGAPHLSNVVTITGQDWLDWLADRHEPQRPEPKPVPPRPSPLEAARRTLPAEGGGGRVSGWQATPNPTSLERQNTTQRNPPRAARREDEPPDRPPQTA